MTTGFNRTYYKTNDNYSAKIFANFTNNESDLDTDEFLNNVQYAIYGICFPIVASIGLLANLASFIVLTRPIMRSSINTYLAGLSFFDGFLLFFCILLYPSFSYCAIGSWSADVFWCRYFYSTAQFTFPMTCIFQSGSVWTMVAITVDRFIAITWPLQARDLLTSTRSQCVLLIIAFWAVIYNIPTFFELEQNSNGILAPTALRADETYAMAYKGYCYLFFMFLIPAVTMIVLNVFVTKAVRNAYKVRRQLSGREEKERRCTLTAVLVVVAFLVLNLMVLMNNCIEIFGHKSLRKTTTFSILVYTGNFLIAVSSASNFIIYCVLGLRFRRMFCKLFCVWCYTPEKYNNNMFISPCYGSVRSNVGTRNGTGGVVSGTAYSSIDGATLMVDLNSDNHSVRSYRHDCRPLLINSPTLSPQSCHRSPQNQRQIMCSQHQYQQNQRNGFPEKKINFKKVVAVNKNRVACRPTATDDDLRKCETRK